LVTLVRILHDHDDDVALALLHRIRESLPAGGKLLIAEPMAETRSARRMGDGYFGFYLWAMGSGRPRSFEEIGTMLTTAGFSRFSEIPTDLPIICRMVVASK
ncbi:MAG: methyltransferase, partial [Tsuneonella sp.]